MGAGSSLFSIFNKGSESLANARTAIDVTGHNISNAHTKGYSRQLVNLESKTPIQYGLHVFGDGAQIQSIARAHDNFLERQIRREVQSQSKTETMSKGLQKLETLFNPDLTSTIRDRLTSFSNAMRDMAAAPEEMPARIHVVESAKALTQSFQAAHAGVVQVQNDASGEISEHLGVLNQKLQEISSLNGQIRELSASAQTSVNDLEDKRDLLLKEVGDIIDVNIYRDANDQIVVRGPNECLLVEGRLHSKLVVDSTPAHGAMPSILVSSFDKPNYMDLTKYTHRGKIGALLEVRDTYAQKLRDNINELATGFAQTFNDVHKTGYGLHTYETQKGRTFFRGLDGPAEPAHDIHVDEQIVADPSAIASAMSPEAAGDNVVANRLIKVFYEPAYLNKTTTATGLYDNMVSRLGNDTLQAKEDAESSLIVFQKLNAQREATSGVSLDEEAANILKFQHEFGASARLITTADQMFQTVLDLKR